MQDPGESPRRYHHLYGNRFLRSRMPSGFTQLSSRIHQSKQSKRPLSASNLEKLIEEQNLLIERLRADLKHEKSIVESVKSQCLRTSEVEEELKSIKALFLNNGLEDISQNAFECFKSKIEQNLNSSFSKTLNDVKSKHQKEIEKLQTRFKEELDLLSSSETEDIKLIREVEALSEYLSKFNCMISSLGKSCRQIRREDIEILSTSLNKLSKCCNGSNTLVKNISQTLIESLERELSIRNELIFLKFSGDSPRNQFDEVQKGFSCLSGARFVQLEHSVKVCNHDQDDKDCTKNSDDKESSGYTLKKMIGELERQKHCPLSASPEIDSLLNYTCKLKNYIKDMVNFHKCRIQKIAESEFDVNNVALSSVVNEVLAERDTISKPDRVMLDLKECYRLIFGLNEVLKSYNENLIAAFERNKLLEEEFKKFKLKHIEETFSLDSHIKLLNEKIKICLKENSALESKFAELHSSSVSRDQYNLLSEEKGKLLEIKEKLEDEVENLKRLNVELENKNHQSDVQSKSCNTDETFNLPECSINYENLIPLNAVTSTPFHPKHSDAPVAQPDFETVQTSLIEWIERCQTLEAKKIQVEKRLRASKFSLDQANINKNILEQEVNILKNNMNTLKDKVADYVLLKEKCHILENDNAVLTIKNNFYNGLQNNVVVDKVGDCDPELIQSDMKFFTSLGPSLMPPSSLSFIDELQKKNQKIIFLETKCRTKDSILNEVNLKLKQSKDMEKTLKSRIEDLIIDNNKIYKKIFSLIEDNAQMNLQKRLSDIELKSVKDQLNYLTSSGDTLNENSTDELIEAMKSDALKFLKESIDRWVKAEQKYASNHPNQVDKFDARHYVEILIKENSLLKSDKEELWLKLSKLQCEIHKLQRPLVDEGWYIQIDKYENDLMKELKLQREQHASTEEALRSTGKLQNDLQKQHWEISSLQKRVEEEKHRSKCSEAEVIILKKKLKEKEKILQETINAKRAIESSLIEMEKELAQKEKMYRTELEQTKWMSQYSQNKFLDSQVKKELSHLQTVVLLGERDKALKGSASLDELYQHSIDSLRFLMEQEKCEALAEASQKHHTKVVKFNSSIQQSTAPTHLY